MQTLHALIEQEMKKALSKALEREDIVPEVTVSTHAEFGDYQCNNAFKLAKELKTNPRALAQKIGAEVNAPFISKVEIAGAGFINLTLDPSFLADNLKEMVLDPRLGIAPPPFPQKVIVEFSSPNVAKELHVGHLRSTVIGDALARLFEFLGEEVLRLSHVGDWGTQFGMLIAYMRLFEPRVLEGKEKATLSSLMQWYRAAKKVFDEDAVFKKEAQLEVVKLQGGNESTRAAWEMICEISRQGYQEIYALLDIRLEERGESFYNPFLASVVADLEKREMVTLSEGAKCVYLDGFEGREGAPLPLIIQKSDGGYNYATTDMAALRHRIEKEEADRIIYVVDAGQALHFQMVFKAAEKAGYLIPQSVENFTFGKASASDLQQAKPVSKQPMCTHMGDAENCKDEDAGAAKNEVFNRLRYNPANVKVEHAAFGVVLGSDGKKFKTRSGETEKLIDLIHEAISQAEQILQERLPTLTPVELHAMAKILGIDALKYADLSCHRLKDYLFSYERMLKFEGNTAPFLLYAYVRIQSIKRKIGKDMKSLLGKASIQLDHPTEIALGLHLRQFGEALNEMARDLAPNRLCEYLYVLAEKFHAFFRDCRVEGDPQEESRLLLCELTARVLHKGLDILGLKVLEKM